MAIEGLSHTTVLSIMSEIGPDGLKKFDTSNNLFPGHAWHQTIKFPGGKVLSSWIPKGSNRLKIALRQAANAIGHQKDTHLSDFFKRVAFRKGRQAAVSATAGKLGVIIWTMVTKQVPYNPPGKYLFLDQKRKMGLAKRITKQIAKFDLKPEVVGFGNSLIPNNNFWR